MGAARHHHHRHAEQHHGRGGVHISGTLTGLAVATGIGFRIDGSGAWTNLTSPTITPTTWASTANDVTIPTTGPHTVCVQEVPSTSITACSATFTVGASTDTIAINTPTGSITAGVAFDSLGGTWTGTHTPTNVDVAYSTTAACPGTGTWATLGGAFTVGSPWSSTGTVTIPSAGTYYMCARKTNFTTTTGISPITFIVVSPAPETITPVTASVLATASLAYTQTGTYTNGPPANLD